MLALIGNGYKSNTLKGYKTTRANLVAFLATKFNAEINLCIAHKWIKENPFIFYKNAAKAKDKEFLTKDELSRIEKKTLKIERIERVKDSFFRLALKNST